MNGERDVVLELYRNAGSLLRHVSNPDCADPLPSRDAVHHVLDGLRAVLFPGYFGDAEISRSSLEYHIGSCIDRIRRNLEEQVRRGLCFVCSGQGDRSACRMAARSVVGRFLGRLPAIQAKLAADVHAAYEGDPAATSPAETIFCYPGVFALTDFRIAHELFDLGVPILPRVITEHAHSITGIDIHPGATIGAALFIDHGTGVVVGETAVIGDRVRIYQGVTLGAKSFPLDEHGRPVKGIARHPIIEDDVVLYAGATVLGRVTIGRGSTIGGNVWLTRSVPPGSVITQQKPRGDPFESGAGI